MSLGGNGSDDPLVFDADETGFEHDVLQRSAEVPVVVEFWADWCEPCKSLGPRLERLAAEYAGEFVLARVDVEANQLLFQQFGVQSIPAAFAVVSGQARPLFQGAAPEAQIRQVLDELIAVAGWWRPRSSPTPDQRWRTCLNSPRIPVRHVRNRLRPWLACHLPDALDNWAPQGTIAGSTAAPDSRYGVPGDTCWSIGAYDDRSHGGVGVPSGSRP